MALSVWLILNWEILDFHQLNVLICAHWDKTPIIVNSFNVMSIDQIGKLRSGAFLVYAHYILALSVWPILYWEILDFHHFDVLTCAHWEHFKIGILFRYTFCVRTKTDIRDTQRIAVKKCNSRYYWNVKVFKSKLVIQWLH